MTLFSLSSRKITFLRVSHCKGKCSFSSMGNCAVKQVYCALQSWNVMWSVSFCTKYERKSVRQYSVFRSDWNTASALKNNSSTGIFYKFRTWNCSEFLSKRKYPDFLRLLRYDPWCIWLAAIITIIVYLLVVEFSVPTWTWCQSLAFRNLYCHQTMQVSEKLTLF